MELNFDVVNEKITDIANARWERDGLILLISQLGSALDEDYKKFIVTNGGGLKRYLASQHDASFRYIKFLSRGGAIAPKDKTANISDDDLERSFQNRDLTTPAEKVPMYWGDVWRAFQSPLDAKRARYIRFDSDQKPAVLDLGTQEEKPDQAYEVLHSDIVPKAVDAESKMVVSSAIRAWAERNSISPALVEFKHSANPSRGGGISGAVNQKHNGGRSFADALALLNDEELRRISIPADLVLSMMRRLG